jgi:hypothetical protein
VKKKKLSNIDSKKSYKLANLKLSKQNMADKKIFYQNSGKIMSGPMLLNFFGIFKIS